MIKSSIQYHVNRQLQCNLKLILPQVDSTASCALYHFTVVKSGILVGFSTLPWQSGNVAALHRGNVVLRRYGSTALDAHGTGAPGYIRAGELQAGSCKLGTSWKLRAGSKLHSQNLT